MTTYVLTSDAMTNILGIDTVDIYTTVPHFNKEV